MYGFIGLCIAVGFGWLLWNTENKGDPYVSLQDAHKKEIAYVKKQYNNIKNKVRR